MIKKIKSKYVVLSETTGRKFGAYRDRTYLDNNPLTRCLNKFKISRHADEFLYVATARRHNEEILYLSGNPEDVNNISSMDTVAHRKGSLLAISSSPLFWNKICKYRVRIIIKIGSKEAVKRLRQVEYFKHLKIIKSLSLVAKQRFCGVPSLIENLNYLAGVVMAEQRFCKAKVGGSTPSRLNLLAASNFQFSAG